MKDRLSQIIGDGREAFRRLSAADQKRLLDRHGTLEAARAHAFAALPEPARLQLVRDNGAVPMECGGEPPLAPARGPVRVFTALALYPKGQDDWEVKPSGHLGRRTMQIADAFDRMRAQCERRGGSFALSPGQVAMGRHYRTLAQDVASSGLRCSSLEALQGGGGGSADGFVEHRLSIGQSFANLRRRVGDGVALPLRRIRPSARGDGRAVRVAIRDLVLVDAVCLDADQTISEVLTAHGWAVKGETVKAAMQALAAALDRMQVMGRGERAPRSHLTA